MCSALDAELWRRSPMVIAAQGSASGAEHGVVSCAGLSAQDDEGVLLGDALWPGVSTSLDTSGVLRA